MIHLTISKERWNNMLEAFITLGSGKFGHCLQVAHIKDEFEALESLFNCTSEELTERLMHLSFIKPSEFQKHYNHYLIEVTKDFHIKKVSDSFLSTFNLSLAHLKNQNLLHLMDQTSGLYLKSACDSQANTVQHAKPPITLFNDTFSFNVVSFDKGKTYMINLYQLYIGSENTNFNAYGLSERGKIKQRKRYEDLIEGIKVYVDQYPLDQKLSINEVCQTFGINSCKLKKMFKEQFQCSVYDYFITLRMQHAHMLVSTGTLAFKEIAYRVGYNEYSSFVKYFRKHHQQLPKQVRLQAQKHYFISKDEQEAD